MSKIAIKVSSYEDLHKFEKYIILSVALLNILQIHDDGINT